MKVLLINGSPHEKGCTYTALSEIADTLKKEGVDALDFWLGSGQIVGCTGCRACGDTGVCVHNDKVAEFTALAKEYDGFVFGSPVHYAGASAAITAFMDRAFYSAGSNLSGKPGATIVSARRAGTTAALDQLNKYLFYAGMPIATSQYWNMVHGNTPEEVKKDLEGLQIMRTLARNLAWMLKCIEAGKNAGIRYPAREPRVGTNFIR